MTQVSAPSLPPSSGDIRPKSGPRRILMLGYDGAQILDVTGPLQTFATAASVHHPPLSEGTAPPTLYQVELAAEKAGPIVTSSGLKLIAERSFDSYDAAELSEIDTLMVAGGVGSRNARQQQSLIAFLTRAARYPRRVASICTGAFLLAHAGLLSGLRVATHWQWADKLGRDFPALETDGDALFVRQGRIWTSAGVTAGMDMTLAMIEEDCGRKAALEVARQQVMYMARPGGQSQFSAQLLAQSAGGGRLGPLIQWMADTPHASMRVCDLADRAAMSERTLARLFVAETGVTPAHFVERLRVDAARRALEERTQPIETIAGACGFSSAGQMRRAFLRQLNITPKNYRRHFGKAWGKAWGNARQRAVPPPDPSLSKPLSV